MCAGMLLPGAEVAVEAHRRLTPDRDDPHAAALAEDPKDALLEVDVVTLGSVGCPAKARNLGSAGTGVDEHAKECRVTTAEEVPVALDTGHQSAEVVLAQHRDGLVDDLG